MYYDARPCGMNGIFATETLKPLKGYYTFKNFAHLRALGTYVKSEYHRVGDFYYAAATDGKDSAILLTMFPDSTEDKAKKDVKIELQNAPRGARVEYYLLDEEHDATLISEEIFSSDHFAFYRTMTPYSTYLIKINAL